MTEYITVEEHEETRRAAELDLTNRKLARYLLMLETKIERLEEQIDRQESLIIHLQDGTKARW